MRKKGTIVSAFEKKWVDGRFKYAPRSCPFCKHGRIDVNGQLYECAFCQGKGIVFRDGYPSVEDRIMVAAPHLYLEHVQKWSKSIASVANPEELPF